MLERLVAFALSQRLFVALSVLLLIGAGLVFCRACRSTHFLMSRPSRSKSS